MSTAVRCARLEQSKGCVKRVRKIHDRSSVPLRRRQAQIAQATLSKANHHGVAVTGLNATQLQQSRSQVASCLAKRVRGKSVAMVLMTGTRDRAHACAVGWLDAVGRHGWVRQGGRERAARQRAATDRRERAKRMQWTAFEHDPFLW